MKQKPARPKIVKEKFFRLVLISIPILILVFLESLLRIFGYGPNLNLFVNLEHNPAYYKINPELGARYFPSLQIKPQTSNDVLLKKKPNNGFRVFVLGGSSAYGYPYGRNGSFPGFLKDRLKDFLPDREVEVVNLAMCAVGSYTVRDIGLELLSYQPDAFIIYAGHNEFYGALGVGSTEFVSNSHYWVNTYLKLRHYKTYQLVRDIVQKIKGKLESQTEISKSVRLMEHLAGGQVIPYKSDLFNSAEKIYFENIKELTDKATEKGAPVYLGELASNIRDLPPFQSIYPSESARDQSEKLFKEIESLLTQNKFIIALEKLNSAEDLNKSVAQFHFLKAHCFENIGLLDSAKSNYIRAKDLDGLRFRAPESFNLILRNIAQQENVSFVPMKSVFEKKSKNNIIGDQLMTDHLHPKLAGYFLMAKSFFENMQPNLPAEEQPQLKTIKPDSIYWHESGVTPLDTMEANFRIQILTNSWPFKRSQLSIEDVKWDRQNIVQRLAVDMIKENITWEQAHVQLAEFYIRNKNFDAALAEYENLIKVTPYNVSPYLQAARIHMQQLRFNPALDFFLQSINVEKTVFAYQGVGEAYLHLGNPTAGIPYLEAVLSLEKNNPLTLFLLAQSYYRAGDKIRSKKVAEQLYRINPGFPGLKKLLLNFSEVQN